MYLPPSFTFADLAEVGAFVDAAQSADLVTFDGGKPVATLLPVIWDRPEQPAEGDYGRVLGHLAIANDQWKTAQPGAQALVIVHGPQAYISPNWYESTARHGRTVPTWNYELVLLTGPVTFHRDPEWLRDMVTRLTRRHEDGRDEPWTLADAPADYITGQLRAIVGVEVAVASVEAKQKLGQNRGRADQESAAAGLRGDPGPGPAAVADLMLAHLSQDAPA